MIPSSTWYKFYASKDKFNPHDDSLSITGSIKNHVLFTRGTPEVANPKPWTPMWFHPNDSIKVTKVYKHTGERFETKFKGFGDTK